MIVFDSFIRRSFSRYVPTQISLSMDTYMFGCFAIGIVVLSTIHCFLKPHRKLTRSVAPVYADAYAGSNTQIRDTINNLIEKSPQNWHTTVGLPFRRIEGTVSTLCNCFCNKLTHLPFLFTPAGCRMGRDPLRCPSYAACALRGCLPYDYFHEAQAP